MKLKVDDLNLKILLLFNLLLLCIIFYFIPTKKEYFYYTDYVRHTNNNSLNYLPSDPKDSKSEKVSKSTGPQRVHRIYFYFTILLSIILFFVWIYITYFNFSEIESGILMVEKMLDRGKPVSTNSTLFKSFKKAVQKFI